MADRTPELTLAVEPLNRFECYMLNTAAQAAAHVARVGRPNFGYLYDTFHANIEERDPVGVIGETIGAINYIHISENDRGTPGKGHIDLAAAIRAAKARGLRRLVHHRGLRPGYARPRGGDPDLAAHLREHGGGDRSRGAGDPRRVERLRKDQGGTR